jgi:hypothetical protein
VALGAPGAAWPPTSGHYVEQEEDAVGEELISAGRRDGRCVKQRFLSNKEEVDGGGISNEM